jgi:hypothetical protein
MPTPSPEPRDLILPTTILHALRASTSDWSPANPIPGTLLRAGVESGRSLLPEVERTAAGSGSFWEALGAILLRRGFGKITHRQIHPGLALLEGVDGPESDPPPGSDRRSPGCIFTSGLLSGVLSAAAGREVQLREVACRSWGAHGCCWAFGSPAALDALEQAMEGGTPLQLVVDSLMEER